VLSPPSKEREVSRLPLFGSYYHDFGPCVGLTMAQTFGREEDGSKHVDHRSEQQDAEHILGRCSRLCILCSNAPTCYCYYVLQSRPITVPEEEEFAEEEWRTQAT
jgi:hypothetical protein